MTDYFLRPYLLVLLVFILPIVIGWTRRQMKIRHSSLEPHKGTRSKSLLLVAASVCLSGMTASIILASMGPKVPDAVVEHKAVIRKVCLSIDRSGSMTSVLQDGVKDLSEDDARSGNTPGLTVNNGGNDKFQLQDGSSQGTEKNHPLTRIKGAQLAARYIIRHRMSDNPAESDQFCLMTFDDDTYMMAPLTNDKRVLLLRTAHITENVGGGTNFSGPYGYVTGIGALQKAVDYFAKNASPESTAVFIMITDGEDSIPAERYKKLLDDFKHGHIHFYVIGLGESWTRGSSLDLAKFAEALHAEDESTGFVFRAANPGDMNAAMEKINQLEKAQEIVENHLEYREVYGWFLLAAALFGFLFVTLSTLARRVP